MNTTTFRPLSAVVALTAVLLIASPVFAAKPAGAGDGAGGNGGGNGSNQGTVKVVNADSLQESDTGNEPHVCGFYLVFEAPDGESGTWSVVDWPPTGTGVVVGSGGYAVPAGGSFSTGLFSLSAGHYRVNWLATGAQTEKHKTLWVDACDVEEPEDQPTDQPTDEPTDEPTDQPTDEPTDEPTEEPQDQPTDEPTEEPEETETQPEGEVAESTDGSQPPTDDPDPTEVQQPDEPTEPQTDLAPANGGAPAVDELPDSAMSMPEPVLPGAASALGILLLLVGHRIMRDRGRIPR